MPESALANVEIDHLLPAAAIGAELGRILDGPAGLVCPDCGGALAVLTADQNGLGCRSGHVWSTDALLDTTDEELQSALWTAVQSLDDKVELAERMAAAALLRGNTGLAQRYSGTMEEARTAAKLLRGKLTAGGSEIAREGGGNR